MDEQELKCVIVADEHLSTGVLVNTAAILGITLGARLPGVVGNDATDASGEVHPGIITFPVPILKSDREGIRALRGKLKDAKFEGVFAADFSDVAQCCQTYPAYIEHAATVREEEHNYLGLMLCGDKKLVNKLTGSMGLLR